MTTSTLFQQWFERFALISLEKQYKLAGLVPDQTHELDLDAAKVRFAGREITMQVVGTESANTLTWLWAWAEEQTEIPEQLLDASLQLRSWGAEAKLTEFTAPSIDLDTADGFAISLIAAQVCNASCHFRDIYEGGSAYLLLFDRTIDGQPGFDRTVLVQAMTDLFSQYQMNHKNALLSYLQLKGLQPAEQDSVLSVELDSRERMVVEFDDRGRIVVINGSSFLLHE